ncbi:PorV/PorQ family protein [candidate division KSB1 bacterium]|nr:PorV/PorQ family protein [candidate division KSB1 bacterium]
MKMQNYLIAGLLILSASLHAADSDGGYAGAFLRMGAGSQAASLGNAFTAMTNDASACYWNPAALAKLERGQLTASLALMTLDRSYHFAALGIPLGKMGALGAGWLQYGVDEIDGRDEFGQKTGDFSDSETAIFLSYAFQLSSNFSIGASGKVLRHSLANNHATGFSVDVGARFQISPKLVLGVTAQDFNGKLKWDTQSELEEDIPLNIRAGAAISPLELPLTIALEAEKNSEQEIKFHAGAQFWILQKLGLRLGVNDGQLTFGGGINLPLSTLQLQADYAYLNDVFEEGTIHQLGFVIGF